MRRLPALFLAAVAGLAVLSAPAAEAAPAKTTKGTIAAPLLDAVSVLGGGNASGEADVPQLRQNCPTGGPLDGVVYRFFDLKGDYRKFRATGPKPVVTQPVPGTTLTANEYDIDLYAFDAKCNRLTAASGSTATGTGFGAFENLRITKPARYVAVTYYVGPYPNIEVTLEYSN
jgi:hypothetical protein